MLRRLAWLLFLCACNTGATVELDGSRAITDGGLLPDAVADFDGGANPDAARSDGLEDLDTARPDTFLSQPDAASPDARPDPDSGLEDAGNRTVCGPNGMTCDRATEVCLETETGPGINWACQPVPPACQNERTCACLATNFFCSARPLVCVDGSDNEIICTCPTCA